VLVDFSQLVRALFNLVENALAYSDGLVEVSAALADKRILVAVEDTGPGIPDSEKDLVFTKFFRGASSAAAPGGTGLGLPITLEIVRSNGGSVRVEDSASGGARFVVALPVTQWEDDQ
jgi:signal transduction histidine kinase